MAPVSRAAEAIASYEQSIKDIEFYYQMIDRVSREGIRACFQTLNAIRIAEIIRKMLGSLD